MIGRIRYYLTAGPLRSYIARSKAARTEKEQQILSIFENSLPKKTDRNYKGADPKLNPLYRYNVVPVNECPSLEKLTQRIHNLSAAHLSSLHRTALHLEATAQQMYLKQIGDAISILNLHKTDALPLLENADEFDLRLLWREMSKKKSKPLDQLPEKLYGTRSLDDLKKLAALLETTTKKVIPKDTLRQNT